MMKETMASLPNDVRGEVAADFLGKIEPKLIDSRALGREARSIDELHGVGPNREIRR